ncbi:MAG: hypothetical protein L0229_25065 [Blastocatellia bacterium]|nr:hypothetical protein [Blastocatellia bacterium]
MNSLRPRNLTEYLRALSRRKLAVIVPALAIIIASTIAVCRLPDIYLSSAFIIIDSPANAASPPASSPDLARRLTMIRQQVTSRTRLEKIIASHDLYREESEKGISPDRVIEDMRDAIRVEAESGRASAEAFTISYCATSPETAQRVTAELASQLIAERGRSSHVAAIESQVSGETDAIRLRVTELSADMRRLEEKNPWLLTLKEDSLLTPQPSVPRRSGPSPEAIRAQQMTIEGLKDQEYKLQQNLADVERRIKELTPIVEQQKNSSGLRDNPTYAALMAKRAGLQGQRDNLLNREELTEKHPRVVIISDQIAAIDRQVAELRQQIEGSIRQTPETREMRSLESERNRLRVDLEITGREIKRRQAVPLVAASAPPPASPPPAARDAERAREYLGLKQNYEEALSKLEDAKLKQQTLGEKGFFIEHAEKFRVLDQANLPQLPIWPNRWLLIALAAALGLALGLCLAFALEMRRFSSLQDAKDVEYYTHLPLLAVIPRTLTEGEHKRARLRARLRMAVGALMAVAVTLALTKTFIVTDIFALIFR